jgi:hypothetical protein
MICHGSRKENKEKKCPVMSASFLLEGCVGVGKSSTLASLERKKPDWLVLHEPVEEWENLRLGEDEEMVNVLRSFYEVPDGANFRLLQVSRSGR